MFDPNTGRWPPVYDTESLAKEIRELLASKDFVAHFYDQVRPDPAVCQGDILELPAHLPYLDEHGDSVETEEEICYWIVLGNTCDFSRDIADVPWTQIIPILDHGSIREVDQNEMRVLTQYQYYKAFYVPPWTEGVADRCHMASFLRPVTVHKSAVMGKVVARMSHKGWALLHTCIIRFFARDDGRAE